MQCSRTISGKSLAFFVNSGMLAAEKTHHYLPIKDESSPQAADSRCSPHRLITYGDDEWVVVCAVKYGSLSGDIFGRTEDDAGAWTCREMVSVD
jgi:hypothetical protein